jgi:hypothetical protein
MRLASTGRFQQLPRSWRRISAVVLLSSACSTDNATSPTPPADAGSDAPVEEAGPPVDLDAISERALDTLSREEAQALCEADARRADRCRELGVSSTQTPAECEEYVTACKAGGNAVDPATLCRGVTFGPPGTCQVSVGEYLRCADAWKDAVKCSEAGYMIEPPAACAGVVAGCARFADQFSLPGRPYPCDSDAGAGRPPDTDDDIHGLDGCRPRPAKLVILGDSVASTTELQRLLGERLRALSPNLVVDAHALGGTLVAALPGQARKVAPGAGHVFVFIWSIGNDMQTTDLVTNPNSSLAPLHASFDEVFAYFGDKSLFPDGATFLLNTQYWPFDQCDLPGTRRDPGPVLLQRFLQINQGMFLDVAQARPDTIAIDHYPDFLGHADNANIRGCPHCGADNTPWTVIAHPNAAGSAHIADKWAVAFEKMLGASCAPTNGT